ncbi:YHYH protein [Arcticibacterium luteifluviistationis]|uniref:YHYH protein n=1 Tax=Arcticibacterium luteifluviistationis TaxID=1784714 RepID=A0A2Z4GE37_9BACT|nr:YHYH protein [Arcticibacterium luteifluviistationis]AWV99579.1 YHYH protein [Arcticibacterium luteifluviistationis]
MRNFVISTAIALTGLFIISGCDDDSSEDPVADVTSSLSSAFAEFDEGNTDIYLDGSNVVIETNGLPNHTTPYWGEGNALYVEPQDGFVSTPSLLTGYDGYATLTVSANPTKASQTTATSLGAIGIAVSGAAIFNDQEGNGALSQAAVSLDYSGAHIGPAEYHYHTEPEAWTKDDENLVGIIADGFFIYGRKCNSTGTYPTDLDASGGHTSTTQHSTEALYHYHIENELYINKYYIIFPGAYQGTPSSIR